MRIRLGSVLGLGLTALSSLILGAGVAVAAPTGDVSGRAAMAASAERDTPPPKPNHTICRKANHLFANPSNPTTFYECDLNYVPHLRRCPLGTVFHERIQVCDWPENVAEAQGATTGLIGTVTDGVTDTVGSLVDLGG